MLSELGSLLSSHQALKKMFALPQAREERRARALPAKETYPILTTAPLSGTSERPKGVLCD